MATRARATAGRRGAPEAPERVQDAEPDEQERRDG